MKGLIKYKADYKDFIKLGHRAKKYVVDIFNMTINTSIPVLDWYCYIERFFDVYRNQTYLYVVPSAIHTDEESKDLYRSLGGAIIRLDGFVTIQELEASTQFIGVLARVYDKVREQRKENVKVS